MTSLTLSSSDLVSQSSFQSKTMMNRYYVIAAIGVGVLVFSLVIALAVVATQKNNNDVSSGSQQVWAERLVAALDNMAHKQVPTQQTISSSSTCPKNQILTDGYTTHNLFSRSSFPECSNLKDPTPKELANCVLDSYPLIDGHNDLAWQYFKYANNGVYSVDMTKDLRTIWVNKTIHTDIPRIRKGKLSAQFWACYVECETQYKDAVRMSLDQMDTIKKFIKKYPETFKYVTTAQGILDAFKEGKVASLIGLEGGHSIDSSLGNLRMFYELGVRYMTITHSCNTPCSNPGVLIKNADCTCKLPDVKCETNRCRVMQYVTPKIGCTKTDIHLPLDGRGETPCLGQIVVKEMNRIGMLVDLSHVAVETMKAALSISRAPVIFSHSSAFSVCNHYRNVPDDVLNMTKVNGGIVMVNFYPYFINCGPHKQAKATLRQVADHIVHIKNTIGIDHVGIGGDFDGIEVSPEGLEDVSKYPDLFEELARRGWTAEELRKLAGENLIRVFSVAERVRDEMSYLPPFEDWIPEVENKNVNCSSLNVVKS